jgi:hypothetical protein
MVTRSWRLKSIYFLATYYDNFMLCLGVNSSEVVGLLNCPNMVYPTPLFAFLFSETRSCLRLFTVMNCLCPWTICMGRDGPY